MIFLTVLILLLGGGAGAGYLYLQHWSQKHYGTPGEHALKILPRTPTRQIARQLRREGLIDNDLVFLAWLKLQPRRPIQAGDYRIKTPISPRDLLDALRRGVFERTLTIPEGWTARQIAARLVREGWIKAESDWLALVKQDMNTTGSEDILPRNGVEGFLFPETYRLDASARPEDVMNRMLGRFKHEWERLEPARRDPRAANMTTTQVVTLASMIEREARSPEEMPQIASVYYNRMRRGMKLECDATVRYALGGVWDRPLRYADLKTSSPYNTYVHMGLPPGPIANPGRAALAAALRPAPSDYLFYVYGGNNQHVFTRTFSEHMKAVRAARNRTPNSGNSQP